MRQLHVRWGDGDAHELLRDTVAARAGVTAADVEVRHGCRTCGATTHGRPFVVVAGEPGPQVSVSRAGDRSLVAVSDLEVGVDVEVAAVGAHDGLAAVALSGRERSELATKAPGLRGETVLRTWVRKEALLKALGHGLTVDPRLVELSLDGPCPRLTGWSGPGGRPRVHVHDVGGGAGFVAAVAWVGRRRVRLRVDTGFTG